MVVITFFQRLALFCLSASYCCHPLCNFPLQSYNKHLSYLISCLLHSVVLTGTTNNPLKKKKMTTVISVFRKTIDTFTQTAEKKSVWGIRKNHQIFLGRCNCDEALLQGNFRGQNRRSRSQEASDGDGRSLSATSITFTPPMQQ